MSTSERTFEKVTLRLKSKALEKLIEVEAALLEEKYYFQVAYRIGSSIRVDDISLKNCEELLKILKPINQQRVFSYPSPHHWVTTCYYESEEDRRPTRTSIQSNRKGRELYDGILKSIGL